VDNFLIFNLLRPQDYSFDFFNGSLTARLKAVPGVLPLFFVGSASYHAKPPAGSVAAIIVRVQH
jgi:hypothetical protein